MDYSKEISSTLNYIEQNLSDNLSLMSLSRPTYLSQFHYHRIFLNDVGTSVVNYIKTRRIIRATYLLILTDQSITDIALISGFNDIDTFTRVFKRFYGITPSGYRSTYEKNYNYVQQEDQFMSEKKLFERLEGCTREDKRQCLETLDKIIEISKEVHKNGLLSLESRKDTEQMLFLKKGLELLLAGTKPDYLRDILWNYINVGNYTPREVLERIVILKGILLIQAGEYPWIIRDQLSSFFGEEFISDINEWYGLDKDIRSSILELQERLIGKRPYSEETIVLEKEFKNMDARSIQRLLREVDLTILAFALKGASGDVSSKVINSLSQQNQRIFIELDELLSDASMAQMVDSQNEVLKIIKALRLSKDIM